MGKYTTLTIKREAYEVLKETSDLCRLPIAKIIEDFALNLKKALDDVDSEHFNVFTIAFGYDDTRRVVIAKILESLFGYSIDFREIKNLEKRIEKAVKSRREKGVLA